MADFPVETITWGDSIFVMRPEINFNRVYYMPHKGNIVAFKPLYFYYDGSSSRPRTTVLTAQGETLAFENLYAYETIAEVRTALINNSICCCNYHSIAEDAPEWVEEIHRGHVIGYVNGPDGPTDINRRFRYWLDKDGAHFEFCDRDRQERKIYRTREDCVNANTIVIDFDDKAVAVPCGTYTISKNIRVKADSQETAQEFVDDLQSEFDLSAN